MFVADSRRGCVIQLLDQGLQGVIGHPRDAGLLDDDHLIKQPWVCFEGPRFSSWQPNNQNRQRGKRLKDSK